MSQPGKGEIGNNKDRDLLSLMIKANMSTEIPVEQRLSVDQILHQIPTFLVAGAYSSHSNVRTPRS